MKRYMLAALLALSFGALAAQEENPFQAAAASDSAAAKPATGPDTRYVQDDIAAVVGDEVILASEIKMELITALRQNRIPISDTAAIHQITHQVLDEAIAQKVLLHQAKEAKVEVAEDELNPMVESQLKDMRAQFPSEEAFQRNIAESGLSMVQLKDFYREMMRDKLMGQNFLRDRSHDMPRVKVSEEEARALFDAQAQRPMRPEEVKVLHMLIAPKPGQVVLDSARAKIDSIYAMYKGGADFAYLAEKYSDDPSAAARGGDLGFFSKGEMVKEFEEAAFEMKVGEVRIVRSKYGWHLIRVEARRQKEVRARHILAQTEIRDVDWAHSRELAESLRQRVLAGENFYKLAKENSEDASQLPENPPLLEMDKLEQPVINALKGAMTPLPADTTQRISEVVEARPSGYLVVLEMEYKPAAPVSFEELRDQLIERIQQQKMIEAYLQKLREKTYVEIRFKDWNPQEGF
ncbi:peptidylprolyl isomerase [bacterium]|nr:peptidylprolyl isomerase [bacterium]